MLFVRPERDYLGADSCRYKLRRGQEESAEATIRLWVANPKERSSALIPFGVRPSAVPPIPQEGSAAPGQGPAPAPARALPPAVPPAVPAETVAQPNLGR